MSVTLEIRNVTKYYGNCIPVINDASFKIENNGIVGFLGLNGAGKSTIMKMITGVIRPDKGRIYIDGNEVSSRTKCKIGYLPELNPSYLGMYVTEYLKIFANIYSISKHDRIDYVLEKCGLQQVYKKTIEQLSKGYRQRVGIARAILHDPDILILDEPTSGLDVNQTIGIEELLKNLSINKIIMLSTHILQEVVTICQRLIIIEKGKIKYDTLNVGEDIGMLRNMFK